MDAQTRFIMDVLASPDLEKLPEKAFLGDVCMHQGKPWVYNGHWVTIEDANKIMFNVEK